MAAPLGNKRTAALLGLLFAWTLVTLALMCVMATLQFGLGLFAMAFAAMDTALALFRRLR